MWNRDTRWDKKDPILRFPLKETLSVFKVSMAAQEPGTTNICVGGSKNGSLTVWQAINGHILAEVESAHYMEINDLDVSQDNTDFIITGGKDCKVKVWFLASILTDNNCYVEFNEHQ